tara:strand:+ start:532 stop:1545 length:1014 start_codon:yes stop_codon:yes gene_type:complete
MAISGYDITAANNTLTPPNGAPEGMAPSAVNNIQRQQMANDRAQWNTAEWFEYLDGTPNGTVTYVANNQFKITGQDATAHYHVGRKLKLVDAVPLTTYTSITASSYGSGATLITVSSTALTNVAITAYASILSAINGAGGGLGIDDQATSTQLTITDSASTFANTITGNGSGVTTINGSNITTGTVASARIPTLNQSTTGSAATLTNPRTIAGVAFDGSANIALDNANITNGAGYVTSGEVGSITAVVAGTGLSGGGTSGSVTLNTDGTGSAATLTTARTIAGVSFDGSANISLNNNAITNGAGYVSGSMGEDAKTVSTAAASGTPADGDVWFRYTA